MSAETTVDAPPFVITRTRVVRVNRVSENFARITFGGEGLREFATPGSVFDLRIKLIFAPESGVLPEIETADGWYKGWLALPDDQRGTMRTYSIREIRVDGDDTEIDIDFVLHMEPGLTGPAATWASSAQPGNELLFAGPRRGHDWGGIEYSAGDAQRVLLAGDETAAPAIARIIEDSDDTLRGVAFIEVPSADDFLEIAAPDGFDVRWLARSAGEMHGSHLIPSVLEYLGTESAQVEIRDVETEALLWETPAFSGLGEEVSDADSAAVESDAVERYFWIAGESGVVTTLRRHLVKDLGIDRRQVAVMGYWRRGSAS